MVYILYSELTQKIDTLTHLLNRRSYESRLASLRGHAVIYYFDVDEFKSVNDTFGHGVGDAVLAEVGSTIYAVFSKVGYCYRIGGDEFCVIAQISDTAAEKYLSELWGDRIFEKCGIRRDEEGDGGKTLEIRGKRRLSARDGGANYQQS